MFVELSKLTTLVKDDIVTSFVNYTGNYNLCHQPTGGQLPTSTPLISYVIAIFNHPSMVMHCLLELFRTANEAPSAEFIIIDDNSSVNMSLVVKFIESLNFFFGLNINKLRLSARIRGANVCVRVFSE